MASPPLVDVPADSEAPRRRLPLWPFALAAAIVLLAGLAVAAWNVTLPYYAFSPGPTRHVTDFVEIDGADTFPIDGDLYMLTVVLQEVNGYEALVGVVDDSIDLVPRQYVRPADQSPEDFRRAGLESMDESKRSAIAVALNHLGYDITLTGDGVRVDSVLEDTPAAQLLEVGDVIQAVDGTKVLLAPDMIALIGTHSIGDEVTLTIRRGEEIRDVTVTLVPHPEEPGRPLIGILASTENERFGTLPFELEIDTSNIGGPSAGLMYTLAIIDLLTPEDLVKGHQIAGTGTISSNGAVGSIGGVRQKVVAARAEGADYMLVPAGNFEEALTVDAGETELVRVASLQEAIDFLDSLPAA